MGCVFSVSQRSYPAAPIPEAHPGLATDPERSETLDRVSSLPPLTLDVLREDPLHALYSSRVHDLLSQANLFLQENFNMILASGEDAPLFDTALQSLSDAELLTQDTFDALGLLSKAHILTQDNIDALVASGTSAETVAEALRCLNRVGLLTQDNFDLLFDRNLVEEVINPLLSSCDQFPSLLTQESFEVYISSLRAQKGC